VGIQSVSAWPKNREEIDRVVEWTAYRLRTLSSEIELADVSQQILPSGQRIPLKKVLLGTLGKDASKKTVLIYGHLHVKPALKEDVWNTNPFELTEVDGKLLGCGASNDKGPVLCWVHAIEAQWSIWGNRPRSYAE